MAGYSQVVPEESHLPEKLAQTIDERANFCFGCGPDNPQSLKLSFVIDSADPENITATAIANLTRLHEGPPGYLHGGIIATLMDEAMSKVNRPLHVLAMTRNMEVDYLRPAPIETPLKLVGRHLRREGRKLFHSAELVHPDGTVLARAKGFFLVIDPAVIARELGRD
jgi:uncharacterized protein (TIGR00369 family)